MPAAHAGAGAGHCCGGGGRRGRGRGGGDVMPAQTQGRGRSTCTCWGRATSALLSLHLGSRLTWALASPGLSPHLGSSRLSAPPHPTSACSMLLPVQQQQQHGPKSGMQQGYRCIMPTARVSKGRQEKEGRGRVRGSILTSSQRCAQPQPAPAAIARAGYGWGVASAKPTCEGRAAAGARLAPRQRCHTRRQRRKSVAATNLLWPLM